VGESLGDVVANVRDFGATGNGWSPDLGRLQAAADFFLDDGRLHVLIPAGDYRITGPLYLPHQWQRVTFLAGAQITLGLPGACVYIGSAVPEGLPDPGPAPSEQTIENLTVVGARGLGSVPAVQIRAAAGLLLDGLRVTVSGAGAVGVRVWSLTRVAFEGGRILCEGEQGGVGLQLTGADGQSGVFEPMVVGLTVQGFARGIECSCSTQSPAFVDCDLENDVDLEFVKPDDVEMTEVTVTALTITNCRFAGTGEARIRVAETAVINAGVISGCSFRAPSRGGAIFRVEHSMNGVLVSGCSVFDDALGVALGSAVWSCTPATLVTRVGDMFNAWGNVQLRDRDADKLSAILGGVDGEVTITNRGEAFDAQELGFLGAEPVAQTAFALDPGASTEETHLRTGEVRDLLNSLVEELGRLGVVLR